MIEQCKNIIKMSKISLVDILILLCVSLAIALIYKIYYHYYDNYQIITISNNDKFKDILHKYMNLKTEIFNTSNVDFMLDDKYIKDKNIYIREKYILMILI
jgi:hypothetical protein